MPNTLVTCDAFDCSALMSVPVDKAYDRTTIEARGWSLLVPDRRTGEAHLCPGHFDVSPNQII